MPASDDTGMPHPPETARPSHYYEALGESQRQVDQAELIASRQSRNYSDLQQTQQQVDAEARAAEAATPAPQDEAVQRSWTSRGGMTYHFDSANAWDRQNQEIQSRKWQMANEQNGQTQQSPGADEAKSQEEAARAAIEAAQRQEAAAQQRAQQQQMSRGPGR